MATEAGKRLASRFIPQPMIAPLASVPTSPLIGFTQLQAVQPITAPPVAEPHLSRPAQLARVPIASPAVNPAAKQDEIMTKYSTPGQKGSTGLGVVPAAITIQDLV
jgi:hypothetical protein